MFFSFLQKIYLKNVFNKAFWHKIQFSGKHKRAKKSTSRKRDRTSALLIARLANPITLSIRLPPNSSKGPLRKKNRFSSVCFWSFDVENSTAMLPQKGGPPVWKFYEKFYKFGPKPISDLKIFVLKFEPVDGLSASPVARCEVAALEHEFGDDPMEFGAFVAVTPFACA